MINMRIPFLSKNPQPPPLTEKDSEKAYVDVSVGMRGRTELTSVYAEDRFENYVKIYRNVPEVFASVEHVIDQMRYAWFRLEGGKEAYRTKLEKWRKTYDEKQLVSMMYRCLAVTGNLYLDVRMTENNKYVKNVLLPDPDTMFVKRDPYGEIKKYYQKSPDGEKLLDELAHITINRVSDKEIYGKSEFYSIRTVLNSKLNIEADVVTLVHNYAFPLVHWKLGLKDRPANRPSIQAFRNAINRQRGRDIVTSTAVEGSALAISSVKIETHLEYFQNQVITGVRTPASFLGRDISGEALKMEIDTFFRKVVRHTEILADAIRRYIYAPMCDIDPFADFIDPDRWEAIPRIVWNELESTPDKLIRIAQLHGNTPIIDTEQARTELGYEGDVELSDSQVLGLTNGATNNPKGSAEVQATMTPGNPRSGQNQVTPSSKATQQSKTRSSNRGSATDKKKTNR